VTYWTIEITSLNDKLKTEFHFSTLKKSGFFQKIFKTVRIHMLGQEMEKYSSVGELFAQKQAEKRPIFSAR
jgi:hypothetical protein